MTAPAIDNKALQYEIVAQRIGEDVQANQAIIDTIENEVDNYRTLARSLQTLQTMPEEESPTSLIPIGADCYVRAKPLTTEPRERLVAIFVGFGFFCEMKPDEGIRFIEKRIAWLQKKIQRFETNTASLRARLSLLRQAIGEREKLVAPEPAMAGIQGAFQ